MNNMNRKNPSLRSPGFYKQYLNRCWLSANRWISNAVLILLTGLSINVHAQTVTEPVIGTVTANTPGWSPLVIVNITEFPWDVEPRFNARTKTFFRGPKVGAFIYCIFSPTWNTKMPPPGLPAHYHLWHKIPLVANSRYIYFHNSFLLVKTPYIDELRFHKTCAYSNHLHF